MTTIYMMTIPTKEISKRELLFRLRRRAKRWQFGQEVGTHTGYEHYQVRYECSNGDYEVERRIWGDIKCELQQSTQWSDYERKDGNYYTDEDNYLGKYRFGRLRPIQLFIEKVARSTNDRQIVTVIDHVGGTGKTFYARWKCLNEQGIYVDGTGNQREIVRNIYDLLDGDGIRRVYAPTGCIFVDLTRSQNLRDCFGALEQVKNGYLKDERYGYRERWVKPPRIVCFTNNDLSDEDWKGLSKDRWVKVFLNKTEDGTSVKVYETGKASLSRFFKA